MDVSTDGQTDSQTARQTDGQTDHQTDRPTDGERNLNRYELLVMWIWDKLAKGLS